MSALPQTNQKMVEAIVSYPATQQQQRAALTPIHRMTPYQLLNLILETLLFLTTDPRQMHLQESLLSQTRIKTLKTTCLSQTLPCQLMEMKK